MRFWTLILCIVQVLLMPPLACAASEGELDRLFSRMGQVSTDDDAAILRQSIEAHWRRGDGDTLNLLMSRVQSAVQAQNYTVALNLLNHLVKLAPDWAEAWNSRAALRALLEDDTGALTDFDRALRLEPRHFDALVGEGMIFMQQGKKPEALKAYQRALFLCPHWPQLDMNIRQLILDVEGQDI